jgi:hypothetical protein
MTARRVVGGCGIAAVVALLLGGCGIAAVVSRLPAGEHPDVDFEAAEISSARAAKVAELERELDAVDARYGSGRVGPRWRVDRCEAGQDNFTREDQYAYSCRMRIVELLPVRAPARAELSRLGEALLPGACPGGTNVDRELAEHSGRPEQLVWVSGDCTPGQLGGGEIVKVLPAQPSAEDDSRLEVYLGKCVSSPIAREHCLAEPIDTRSAAASAPPGTEWLAAVSAWDAYYLIPWECDWPASWLEGSCRGGPVVR